MNTVMRWERLIPKSYLIKSEVCGVECICEEDSLTFNYVFYKIKKIKLK